MAVSSSFAFAGSKIVSAMLTASFSFEISFMGNYGGDPKTGTFRIVTRSITQADLTSGDLVIDDVLTENAPYYIGVTNTHNISGARTGKYKGTDIELEVTTMVLDSRDRAFSTESYVFSDDKISEIRLIAKQFCEIYGKIAVKNVGLKGEMF